MTDIEQVFLADIIRNLDDDTPRLVYADWLEIEQGQAERAEFIRVQCRIAALERDCSCGGCVKLRGGGQHTNGPCAVDQERDELPDGRRRPSRLRVRAGELWGGGAHDERHWIHTAYGALPADVQLVPGGIRRGFIARIRCPLDAWHGRGPALCREHPIEGVEIAGVAPENVGGRGRRFMWYLQVSAGQVEPHYLPAWLMSCLPRQSQLAGHKTPQHAHDALNAAALLWARAEGLSTPRGEA